MTLEKFFGVGIERSPIDKLIDNLNYLKSLSVEEQTFLKKWQEIQSYRGLASNLDVIKNKIWVPHDIYDEDLTVKQIEECEPELVYVGDDKNLNKIWTYLRVCVSTFEFNQTPGRFLKFLIVDKNNEERPYIGILGVSSDVISISDRDVYIGWTGDNKLKDKKLAHSAIGSTIVSTQPFGYNFLGGKLSAAMVVSDVVRKKWQELYNQTLVGMTTTSLYGTYSMYNGLKWWKSVGSSNGKIAIKPDNDIYEYWHTWIKKKHPDKYKKAMTQKEGVSGPVTGAKSRILSMMFRECRLKQSDYVHGYKRGVYYSCFYENSREFLKNQISEEDLKMKPIFEKDMSAILEWWKPRAITRYKKLKEENRLKSDILFYHNMIGEDYDTCKKLYFNEVGR
jgi:hypothetical protein